MAFATAREVSQEIGIQTGSAVEAKLGSFHGISHPENQPGDQRLGSLLPKWRYEDGNDRTGSVDPSLYSSDLLENMEDYTESCQSSSGPWCIETMGMDVGKQS